MGAKTIPVPIPVGHEYVGEIVEIGQEVRGFKVSDRVSGRGHITCGYCHAAAPAAAICAATRSAWASTARRIRRIPGHSGVQRLKIPDDISDDLASIFDPFGNVPYTALSFNLVGQDVLITGIGPIGSWPRHRPGTLGALRVVTDVSDYRLDPPGDGRDPRRRRRTRAAARRDERKGMTEGFDVGMEMSACRGLRRCSST
jgi:threonine 3-dehydrogenase